MTAVNQRRLVASLQWRDATRQRGLLLTTIAQPLVLFLILVLVPAAFIAAGNNRKHSVGHRVAVQARDATMVSSYLREHGYEVDQVHDVLQTVARQSVSVGLVLPPNSDRLIATGASLTLQIVSLHRDDVSSLAAADLNAVLRTFAEDRAARAGGADIHLAVTDLAKSASGLRGAPRGFPLLVLFQVLAVERLASSRLADGKEQRSLEALLVLPIHRRQLLYGIGTTAFILGALSCAAVVLPLGAGVSAVVAGATHHGSDALATMAVLAVSSVCLLVTLDAAGLLAGAMATPETSTASLSQVVYGLMLVVGLLAQTVPGAERIGALLFLPVVGPLMAMRRQIGTGMPSIDLLAPVACAALFSVLLVRRAAAVLTGPLSVARSGS